MQLTNLQNYFRYLRYTFILVSLLSLVSCNNVRPLEKSNASIRQSKFTLKSLGPIIQTNRKRLTLRNLRRGTINVGLDLWINVYNPTNSDLSINRMNIRVIVNKRLIATAILNERVELPAKKLIETRAYLAFHGKYLTPKFVRRLKRGRIKFQIEATFYSVVNNVEIPVTVMLR